MIASQQTRRPADWRNGSRESALAELRRRLADPSKLNDGNRQRLLNLRDRLAQVQALGGDLVRVQFSTCASEAMDRLLVGA